MPYVYSTATNSIEYEERAPTNDKNAIRPVVRKVTIKGGTGLANKHLITPEGVATHVSDEDADFLDKHEAFNRHRDAGYMVLRRDKVKPEKVAAEMKSRDDSKPITPDDYKDVSEVPNESGVLAPKPQKIVKKAKATAEEEE